MVAPSHSLLFDELIDQVMREGYAVTDQFFDPASSQACAKT